MKIFNVSRIDLNLCKLSFLTILSAMIIVKEINDAIELEIAFKIRELVFVEEQSVSIEEEFDEFDPYCRHFLASLDSVPCGTARLRETKNGIKLERFSVLGEYRNKKIGKYLVQTLLKEALFEASGEIYLHAQVSVLNFYKKEGFLETGDVFLEANIPHQRMIFQGMS